MIVSNPFVYDLDLSSFNQIFTGHAEPSFRSKQVWQGLYKSLWENPDEYTNIPKKTREWLSGSFSFSKLHPLRYLKSKDGDTLKTLFELQDHRQIETVLMRYDERRTLCISTQSGCAMGCTFCATGQMGFQRNLTSGEIIEQVIYYARMLKQTGEHVTNVVVMGMGEPFQNYEQTMAAIDRLNDPEGFNLGARRFTISTVGLVPIIRRFADEKRQINLAISLHAASDELRSSMLPINRKYSIETLLEACRYYVEKTSRRITFEWALISGVNDRAEDARLLAQRIKGLLCHVNVIPLNPTEKFNGQPSSHQQVQAFCNELKNNGIPCTIRIRRGIEIQAGCGQLASHLDQAPMI